jgi:hypothetical protein
MSGPPVSPWPVLPVGPPNVPVGQPRIVPSAKPPRSRIALGILLGLLAGLVLFGPTGYLARVATAPAAQATPAPTPAPTSPGTLPAFERSQLALNQGKVSGDLVPFARSWLPYITGCNTTAAAADPSASPSASPSTAANAPKLGDGEKTRVVCRYASVSVYLVQFTAAADRDRALARRKSMAADAKSALPGMTALQQRRTTSGNANGNYIEYGFKSDSGKQYAAIWWDNTNTAIAGYLVAEWHDGLNESWDPLRDVWQRYS